MNRREQELESRLADANARLALLEQMYTDLALKPFRERFERLKTERANRAYNEAKRGVLEELQDVRNARVQPECDSSQLAAANALLWRCYNFVCTGKGKSDLYEALRVHPVNGVPMYMVEPGEVRRSLAAAIALHTRPGAP